MSIYDTLNAPQKEAVYQTDGPVLILAGAGSGKTRVLTHRVAFLIEEGVNPWNIMAITFTNKAAGEMRERVDRIVGYGAESIWIATFHSSCARILRRYIDRLGYDTNFAIYDTDDAKSIIKEVAKKNNIDTKQIRERTIMNAISAAKNELIGPEEYALDAGNDYTLSRIAACYVDYQKTLKKNNALDFDDLLFKCVELFRTDEEVLRSYQDRFKYICVDEYQDTNTAQFEFVRLLAQANRNICVVGDDDQSIYKFRGANIRNILDFEKVYPEAKVIKLEQNYRSTSHILDAANAVIRNNKGRKSKALWTDKGEGEKIKFKILDSAYDESKFITSDIAKQVENGAEYNQFAVLYRTNAQSRMLEESMVMSGMPYNVVGGVNFYSRREIKDILSYLKTVSNGRDDLACKRIINIPKRGIGATSIAKIQDYADAHGISFFDACMIADQIQSLGRSSVKITPFATAINLFRSRALDYSLSQLFDNILDHIGYEKYLEELDEEDTEDRLENIQELRNKIIAYEEEDPEATLEGFLEEVALVADIDSVEGDDNRVLLMTIHAAKGLEFDHVYLAGMEDGVFPSGMTIASFDPDDIEEERRLAYVAITRARDVLTITAARARMLHGETSYNPVSRFVREIPRDLIDDVPEQKPSYSRIVEDEVPNKPTKKIFSSQTASVYGQSIKPVAKAVPKTTPSAVQPYILQAATKANSNGSGTGNSSGGLGYGVGDRVAHIKYGEGIVAEINPGSKDYQVTVDFDNAGRKIMYAGFAKLKLV